MRSLRARMLIYPFIKIPALVHAWQAFMDSSDGSTPLHVAASSGCIEATKALVAHGAALATRRADGLSSLGLARLRMEECPCYTDSLYPGRKCADCQPLLHRRCHVQPALFLAP